MVRSFYLSFSALQRAEIAEMGISCAPWALDRAGFSALQRAEIAEMFINCSSRSGIGKVSVLFNEPKLLKSSQHERMNGARARRFSALQRAEIAEIRGRRLVRIARRTGFSALQRAEIAEIFRRSLPKYWRWCFSALQRAEIAEIGIVPRNADENRPVSVLFNEPKLLKSSIRQLIDRQTTGFQCSSTSRNC